MNRSGASPQLCTVRAMRRTRDNAMSKAIAEISAVLAVLIPVLMFTQLGMVTSALLDSVCNICGL